MSATRTHWGHWGLLGSIVVASCVSAIACSREEATDDASSSETSELDKVEWLEKAAKALRNGEGLGPHDDVAALTQMSKGDVVDLWMKDPRFGDAVLAFNLYYLNRPIEQIRTQSTSGAGFNYSLAIFDLPQAYLGARAVVAGGDYFDLYAADPPFVTQLNPLLDVPQHDGERQRVGAAMTQAADQVATDRAAACRNYVQAGLQATNRLRLLGFSPSLLIRQRWLTPTPGYPLTVDCTEGSTVSGEELATAMRTVESAIDAIWSRVEASFDPRHPVMSLTDLPAIPVNAEGLPALVAPFGPSVFAALPVSSTNFHRKRAAYMLKTYFCDDLTPLSIPAPDAPDGGDGGAADVHASNSNCQACHYRLDPIGAMFRNIGAGGHDFTGQGFIQFDDGVAFSGDRYQNYLKQWQNPDGTYRAGYWVLGPNGKPQRAPDWKDEDGDTLRGLWSYLPRSQVARACVVKKLAEYVLGPGQVYDGLWLTHISGDLMPGPQSGQAFKQVFKSLVLSKTFGLHNPQKGECYDVPEDAPPNRAPCAIASAVANDCARCHDSVDGPGHLSFNDWIDLGGGVHSWAHQDDAGNQLSQKESLSRILARITSSDPAVRMPLFRSMPQEDFVNFKSWLTTTLDGL